MDRIDEFLKSLLNKSKEDKSFSQGKEHTCPSEEIIACYLDNLLNDTEKEKACSKGQDGRPHSQASARRIGKGLYGTGVACGISDILQGFSSLVR